MASNGMRDLVAIVGMGLSFMVMRHHADAQTPPGRRRTCRALAAALGALLLEWTAPARAQVPAAPAPSPDDTPGTLLLKPPQDPLLVLGQLYGQFRYKEYALLTGYRQLVDDGYVNPNDSRMIPNTFEAATLTGRLGPVGYNVGYLTAMKPRQEDDIQNMAEVAGVQGCNRGLVLTLFSSEPLPGLSLYAANYLVLNVFNTAFGNADHTHAITDDLYLRIGIHYTDQRSTASAFLVLPFYARGAQDCALPSERHDHCADDPSDSTDYSLVEESACGASQTALGGGTVAPHSRTASTRKEQACVTYKTQPARPTDRTVALS